MDHLFHLKEKDLTWQTRCGEGAFSMTKVGKELHVPVMLKEILELANPVFADPNKTKIRYFDGTFGRGGHLSAILSIDPRIEAVAFDRDPEALQFGQEKFQDWISQGRLTLVHANYADFKATDFEPFDFMLLDLGVSSPQLDEGRRGFSFYHEGPLDMRMDPTKGITAADVVAQFSEDDLNEMFQKYGECILFMLKLLIKFLKLPSHLET